jgi:hypothetical protein
MDSLDAQCLVIQHAEGEIRAPEVWRHDRSGALSCGYERGELAFTWRPEQVAQMARTWRDSDASRVPEPARLFVDAHERLVALTNEAGLEPADEITHDLGRAEIRARWDDQKLLLVVEHIGESAFPAERLRGDGRGPGLRAAGVRSSAARTR